MLINGTSVASRSKVVGGGAPIPKIGGGGSGNLSAARRDRRRALA